MDETLADLLNKEVLMELAGERAFDRGADYFADRQVVGLQEADGTITGRVRGTYYYHVKLWADRWRTRLSSATAQSDQTASSASIAWR
jgi:uncharacterized Zn finger protein